jgi:4-carboxymuconolactone decarboxylase
MSQTARFQEILRRLAMIDEGLIENGAGLELGLAQTSTLDPKTAALQQVAVSVAIGSPAVCLEWTASRALAAGASEDEIADVLPASAPVAGLIRVVCAAPDLAIALGYDVAAALEEPMTGGQSGPGWTAILRRQQVRITGRQPHGGYIDVFEIVRRDCGDDPDLGYCEVSPELRRIGGPYPMVARVDAYEKHVAGHHRRLAGHRADHPRRGDDRRSPVVPMIMGMVAIRPRAADRDMIRKLTPAPVGAGRKGRR